MNARTLGIGLLLLASPSVAWAQIPQRFDIDCVWSEIDATAGRAPSTLDDIRQRFRVDTVRRAQCEAECSMLFSIAEATPDHVVLMRTTAPIGVMEYRADGTFIWDTEYPDSHRRITRRGTCQVRRFSGFPRDARDHTDD